VKISTDLQTTFAAEAHLAQGQWLWEQQNVEKFRMFREGTRIPTVIIIIIIIIIIQRPQIATCYRTLICVGEVFLLPIFKLLVACIA
jgi:fumarate reductase subunit C